MMRLDQRLSEQITAQPLLSLSDYEPIAQSEWGWTSGCIEEARCTSRSAAGTSRDPSICWTTSTTASRRYWKLDSACFCTHLSRSIACRRGLFKVSICPVDALLGWKGALRQTSSAEGRPTYFLPMKIRAGQVLLQSFSNGWCRGRACQLYCRAGLSQRSCLQADWIQSQYSNMQLTQPSSSWKLSCLKFMELVLYPVDTT